MGQPATARSVTVAPTRATSATRADAPVRVPAHPGWYPDPERRATTRFFDGRVWTEHSRGPAPLAALTDAAKARTPIETRSYGRFENRPAAMSILVGAISIVVNPLLIPSIVALVLGVKGLRRSRMSLAHYGRERAMTGIALAMTGVATAAVTLVAVVAMLTPTFQHAQRVADAAAVRAAVAQHVTDRGAELLSLDCPPSPPARAMVCEVTTKTHERLRLDVTLPADGGAIQVTEPPVPVQHRPKHR